MVFFYQDFKDMLDCLDKNGVDFLVVGAFAMAHFGYIRATGDIDIWVAPTDSNSPKVFKALKDFGAPLFGIDETYFSVSGNFLQLGVPPSRIDIITKIDGVSFQEAFASKEWGQMSGRNVPFLSLDLLIANKEATGREKDKPDAVELRKLLDQKV